MTTLRIMLKCCSEELSEVVDGASPVENISTCSSHA
jgi:hypothetical protein